MHATIEDLNMTLSPQSNRTFSYWIKPIFRNNRLQTARLWMPDHISTKIKLQFHSEWDISMENRSSVFCFLYVLIVVSLNLQNSLQPKNQRRRFGKSKPQVHWNPDMGFGFSPDIRVYVSLCNCVFFFLGFYASSPRWGICMLFLIAIKFG